MKVIYGQYIAVDPQILVGKPIFKGTRIPVDLILKKIANNISKEEILKDYPRLTQEQLQEAQAYAHSLVEREEIHILE